MAVTKVSCCSCSCVCCCVVADARDDEKADSSDVVLVSRTGGQSGLNKTLRHIFLKKIHKTERAFFFSNSKIHGVFHGPTRLNEAERNPVLFQGSSLE